MAEIEDISTAQSDSCGAAPTLASFHAREPEAIEETAHLQKKRSKVTRLAVHPARLVESKPCMETVQFFRELTAMAERGEVLGWTGAYMTKDRKFVTHTVGEPDRNPVFTIGMLDILVARLRRKVIG